MTWLWFVVKMGVVLGIVFGLLPLLIILERRVSARIQGRQGPNRVGPQGSLQPLADVIKFFMKEDIIPAQADRLLFIAGPVLVFIPPMIGMSIIPFGSRIGDEYLQVAHLNIGVLFCMSVLSVGVYGMALGGWASNNKYSLLGSLRASAQLISYELTLGLTILLAIMMTGTVDPYEMVRLQAIHGWNVFGGPTLLAMPCGILGCVLMFITALAENNRLPFDMAECEAELVGGYHTEYSSWKFALFLTAEYVAMILMSSLVVTLYLGGWHFPWLIDPNDTSILNGLLSVGVFMTKLMILLFGYIWVRWTLPRFRYDQVMMVGWKLLLPTALVNLAVMAIIGVFVLGEPS